MRVRRRGLSLIEVLVFGLLALSLVGLGWGLLRTLFLRGRSTEAKVSATQACLLASARLEDDLDALYEDPDHPFVTGPGLVRFHRRVQGADTRDFQDLAVEAVAYQLDRGGRLVRQSESRGSEILAGCFASLEVEPHQPPAGVAADQAPWVARYRLVAADPEWMEGPTPAPAGGSPVEIAGAVARRDQIAATAYVWWQRAPL